MPYISGDAKVPSTATMDHPLESNVGQRSNNSSIRIIAVPASGMTRTLWDVSQTVELGFNFLIQPGETVLSHQPRYTFTASQQGDSVNIYYNAGTSQARTTDPSNAVNTEYRKVDFLNAEHDFRGILADGSEVGIHLYTNVDPEQEVSRRSDGSRSAMSTATSQNVFGMGRRGAIISIPKGDWENYVNDEDQR
ncbi:uncharacterized protein L201_002532 [Kwoniella dendrophila CBS 6074]|uniref:Uncharacterized protein n=1 Tax=Kwoniella dendrophila CBS 6074 TaxID=1295534 RepID=A0AAX4JSP8_9TREE